MTIRQDFSGYCLPSRKEGVAIKSCCGKYVQNYMHRTTNSPKDYNNDQLVSDMCKSVNFQRTPNTPADYKYLKTKLFCD